MDVIDLVILPFVYLLQMTLSLVLPFGLFLLNVYDDWFYTNDNANLHANALSWAHFLSVHLACLFFYSFQVLLKLIVVSIQVFLLWPILSFWPCFYLGTILDPNGCSLRDMDLDPGYNVGVNRLRPRVSCFTQRHFQACCRVRIQPMQPILGCVFFYTVHGAYAQLGKDTSDDVNNAVDSATKRVFFDDLLWLSVLYCFLMKHAGKPPDNAISHVIAFLGIVVIYVAVIGYWFWQFKRLQRASIKTSKPSCIVLASLQKPYQACKNATSGHSFNTNGYCLSLTTLLLV